MGNNCSSRPTIIIDYIEKINEKIFLNTTALEFDQNICSTFDYFIHYIFFLFGLILLMGIMGFCYHCVQYGGEIHVFYQPIKKN
jgi:hypothetical protein